MLVGNGNSTRSNSCKWVIELSDFQFHNWKLNLSCRKVLVETLRIKLYLAQIYLCDFIEDR